MISQRLSILNIFILVFSLFLIALPLLVIPSISNSYEFPKFVFFIMGVYLLGIITLFHISQRHQTIEITKIHLILILYSLFLLTSNLQGLDPSTSLIGNYYRHQGFITTITGIILVFICSYWSRIKPSLINNLYVAGLISNLLVTSFALYQALFFYFFENDSIPTYQGRIMGTLGNPNFLAGFLIISLPFVLYLTTKKNQRFLVFFKCILIICNLILIFFTNSRGAFFSFLIITVLFIYHYKNRLKNKLLLGLGIIFVIGFLFIFQEPKIVNSFSRYSIWDNRQIIWTEGIKAFQKKPLLGYGQDNFELIFPKNKHFTVDSAHNIFLETLVSSGLIGLILFISILYLTFKKSPFIIKLSLIAFLLRAQFNPLSIAEISFFWLLIGFSEYKKQQS